MQPGLADDLASIRISTCCGIQASRPLCESQELVSGLMKGRKLLIDFGQVLVEETCRVLATA